MKISRLFYLFIGGCLLFLGSCAEPEEIEPSGYLNFDGKEFELNIGYINDIGTNDHVIYRKFRIDLVDQSINPQNHIAFIIYSDSTTRLQEAVYTYNYYPVLGNFSFVKTRLGLGYNAKGEKIYGMEYKDVSYDYKGDITVSMEKGDYKFEFDLIIDIEDTPIVLKGEFHDELKNEYVNY